LVPKTTGDLVAVCSWRLKAKRGDASIWIEGQRQELPNLQKETIIESDFDIAILTPRSPTHRPLDMAINWHGKAWIDAFSVLKGFLFDNKLCKVPNELTHAIYENHFIAKREIYSAYVSECLIPVLSFIDREKGVFQAPSGYIQKLRRDPERAQEYQRLTGRADYPIAPFIIERLFSIWIERKGYKIINL
jgi:hypothetical protein